MADFCTGSGKTVMAVSAALSLLCDDEVWGELRDEHTKILRIRRREPHAGVCRGRSCEDGKLARLAVIVVPPNLIGHWYKTAMSCKVGAQEVFGHKMKINVWKQSISFHSVQQAYDSGVPTLWIVPMTSNSLELFRKNPDIGVGIRIMDELSMKIRSKYENEESNVSFNYITQATIDALRTCTHGQPRHPLRLAFGDNFVPIGDVCKDDAMGGLQDKYPKVQKGLEHFCKLRMWAADEWLRNIVTSEVMHNMPEGLIVHRVGLRVSTLSGMCTGSDMVKVSLLEMGDILMGGTVMMANGWKDQIDDLLDLFPRARTTLWTICRPGCRTRWSPRSRSGRTSSEFRCWNKLSTALAYGLPACRVSNKKLHRDTALVMGCCTGLVHQDVFDVYAATHGKKNDKGEWVGTDHEMDVCPICHEFWGPEPDQDKGGEQTMQAKLAKACDEINKAVAYQTNVLGPEPVNQADSDTEEDEPLSKKVEQRSASAVAAPKKPVKPVKPQKPVKPSAPEEVCSRPRCHRRQRQRVELERPRRRSCAGATAPAAAGARREAQGGHRRVARSNRRRRTRW